MFEQGIIWCAWSTSPGDTHCGTTEGRPEVVFIHRGEAFGLQLQGLVDCRSCDGKEGSRVAVRLTNAGKLVPRSPFRVLEPSL